MTRWQYAWMKDEPQLAVFFSHPQGPTLVSELSAVLGPTLYVQQSTEWVLSLDKGKVNMPYLSGLLGERGWELVSVDSRNAPAALSMATAHTTWYFKRPVDG